MVEAKSKQMSNDRSEEWATSGEKSEGREEGETPIESGLVPSSYPGYQEFLVEIKGRIQEARVRAALAVNRELVLLYWQIGRDILRRQSEQGWGGKVIDRLATDLRQAFPGMSGFSKRN